MYAARAHTRLRAATTLVASLPTAQVAEGEALVSQGVLTSSEAQRSAEVPMQATTDPNVLEAVDTMQTVRPVECPPCPPPTVITRTVPGPVRTVPGPVQTVPGPVRYVYLPVPPGTNLQDVAAQPIGFASYDEWWNALGRDAGIPYNPPASPGGPAPLSTPEQAGAVGHFPWLLLIAGGGLLWYFARKKR